jgi:thymidylate kinase
MTASRLEVLLDYLAELDKRSIPYVVLHSYLDYPDTIPSDVDIAVRATDVPKARRLVWDVAHTCGWVVGQVLQHGFCAFCCVMIDPERPESSLEVDICSHFVSNSSLFVQDVVLLENRGKYRGFYVPCPSSEFAYTLAKILDKQKNLHDYLPRLQELWRLEPGRSQQLFESLAGKDQGSLREWFDRPAEAWDRLGPLMHRRCRFSIRLRLREWQRIAKRALRPTGMRLSFLGPDGVGKSTVISGVQQLVASCFRGQKLFHFCPMLFRTAPAPAPAPAPVTNPHELPPRSVVMSWIKVFYHFCDHWLGYLFQQLAPIIQSACVIFDRDFDDLLIDPRRYRLQHSEPLIRSLRCLLPRSDLTFVLDAPSQTMRERKAEISVDELERQRAALRRLAATSRRFVTISNGDSAASAAQAASREIIRWLEAREIQRERARQ